MSQRIEHYENGVSRLHRKRYRNPGSVHAAVGYHQPPTRSRSDPHSPSRAMKACARTATSTVVQLPV